MADKVSLHRAERSFSRLPTAAHFSQPDQTLISLYFNNGPDKPSPVAAVRMSKRRLQWNGYSRWSYVRNLHWLVRNLRPSGGTDFPFSIFHLSSIAFLFVSVRVLFRESFFFSQPKNDPRSTTNHHELRSTQCPMKNVK